MAIWDARIVEFTKQEFGGLTPTAGITPIEIISLALAFCIVPHFVHLTMDGYLVGWFRKRGHTR
jgi:hypothetical protein